MTEEQQSELFEDVPNAPRAGEYELPAAGKVERCRSCDAAIVWTRTPNGRATPLSLATVQTRGGVRYALSHFADCPHAKDWSKKR